MQPLLEDLLVEELRTLKLLVSLEPPLAVSSTDSRLLDRDLLTSDGNRARLSSPPRQERCDEEVLGVEDPTGFKPGDLSGSQISSAVNRHVGWFFF